MIDRPKVLLPGVMELAESIDRLATDGHPMFARISMAEPKWISSGGHLFPPRAALVNGALIVSIHTTTQVQRLTCDPANGLTKHQALAIVEAHLQSGSS